MPEKTLKFKNYFLYSIREGQKILIISFLDWLALEKLHGPASLNRSRFIKLIADRAKEIDEQRVEIAKENSKNKKGEVEWRLPNGKIVTKEPEDPKSVFDIKDMGKFFKEWNDYLSGDYIIDVTPANKEIINGVKSVLDSTRYEFGGSEAENYVAWIEAFEDIWKKEVKTKDDPKTPQVVKDLIKKKEDE